MKTLIMAAILFVVAVASTAQTVDPLDAAVADFVKVSPLHPLNDPAARKQYLSEVRRTSAWWKVPADLLVTIHRLESAYRTDVIGKRGEVGISQVHPSMARDCELVTRAGQMACGAKRLSEWFKKCGTWEGALTAYAQKSGHCKADNKAVKRKINHRMAKWREIAGKEGK